MTKTLLSFGHGYSAQALRRRLLPHGWQITGTTRSADKALALQAAGIAPAIWPGDDLTDAIAAASHILVSAAPTGDGDPVLAAYADVLRAARPDWVGYLSTTGVYGDRQGAWVDETTPPDPRTPRGQARVAAETAWSARGLPVHIFRLAGIYGPGRGPFAKVRNGTARRIVKPGQVFSRIHVEDIAQVLEASIKRPAPGTIYNVCDDLPAPPEDVLGYAAQLLGAPLPPEELFETANMTPMARSFYMESRRVRNDRLRDGLGVDLL